MQNMIFSGPFSPQNKSKISFIFFMQNITLFLLNFGMKCELDLLFQDHPQRFGDFNMWFLFLYFFSLMHSKPCFYLTCSAFLFVSISNAYGRSGKHKPVGMWWNTVWWNYLITSAHLSMPLRWDAQKHIPPSPRWLSEELHVLHSLPPLSWSDIKF